MARQLLLTLCICAALLPGTHGERSKWHEMNGTEWYLTEDSKETFTWHRARAFCMNLGADLASVHTQAETDQLMKWSKDNRKTEEFYWMGFNNLDRERFSWSDGSSVDYTNWEDGYPDNENYGHFCTYSKPRTNGEWYNEHCALKHGVMCRRPLHGTSPPPITDPSTKPPSQLGYCPTGFIDAGKKCYKVVPLLEKNGVTFEEALGRCRLEAGRTPDLASIHNSYENAVIASQMETFQLTGLWIGLFRRNLGILNKWLWTDNSALVFTYWEKSSGPEMFGSDCAEMVYRHPPMGHTGSWNNTDSGCKLRRGYVCQTYKDASKVITTPASTTTNICPGNAVPYDKACYRLVTQAMSWEDANRTCASGGATLVSIHSEPANSFLFAMATRVGVTSPVWIGLHHSQADGVYYWTNGWYVMYTRWGKNQPKLGDDGGCVVMGEDGRWSDDSCSTLRPFFCETTTAPPVTPPVHTPGMCPRDEEWMGWGDYCYAFIMHIKQDWYGAAEQCRQIHEDALLVSIHNEVDNDFIYKNVKQTETDANVWIGLYRGATDGEFKWLDQTSLQYQHWKPGSPEEVNAKSHCVQMSVTQYPKMWEEQQCSTEQGFICKTLKRPEVTSPPNMPGLCPDESWTPYGENCYLFEPDMFSSWTSAQTECIRRGGGHTRAMVASIVAEHESKFIHYEMQRRSDLPKKRNYWLGGKKDGANEPFYWIDGQDFNSYEGWASKYPEPDPYLNCIIVTTKGLWQNTRCDSINAYVCKVKKQREEGIPSTEGAPGTGLNDPGATIAAAILGVALALLVAASITYFFLKSSKAPRSIAGFSNPLAPTDSDTTLAWSANEGHGST